MKADVVLLISVLVVAQAALGALFTVYLRLIIKEQRLIHVAVNSNMEKALNKIDELHARLAAEEER